MRAEPSLETPEAKNQPGCASLRWACHDRRVTSNEGSGPETGGFLRVPSMPVLDLMMRVGDHLLASGMSANDVVVQMLRITRAFGLTGVHVDLTYTSITLTHYRGPTKAPLTVTRVVQPLVVDYTKVRDLDRLLARIEEGLGIEEATARYDGDLGGPAAVPRLVRDPRQRRYRGRGVAGLLDVVRAGGGLVRCGRADGPDAAHPEPAPGPALLQPGAGGRA